MDAAKEEKQGKTIADVAKTIPNLSLLIWSSLPNVTKLTNGALKEVEHFDSKAAVEAHIRELGLPATFFMPAFFMSNIKTSLRKDPAGGEGYMLALTLGPDDKIPLIDIAADTGNFVAAALKNPVAFLGKNIVGAAEYSTPSKIVAALEKTTGKPVKYVQLQDEQLKGILTQSGNPKPAELVENFILIREWLYYGKDGEEQLEKTLQLVDREKLTTFDKFVAREWPWM
jgi:uncharacterized protein YbjT (DUF2867 family)